jgi:uncharacterized alkaline shock family protein YloU
MSAFDRTLLAVYTVFITVITLLIGSVLAGWTVPLLLFQDAFLPGRPEIFWPVLILVVLAGVRLFWVITAGPKGREVVVAESALGQTRISLQAFENLVTKVVSQIGGVREVKAKIFSAPQGIGVQVRVAVTPDINIPVVSGDIQGRVKEQVLNVTGISVSSIKVMVENISARRPRVE